MFHKLRSDRIKQAPIRPSSFVLLFMCFSSGRPVADISNIGLVEAIRSVETKLQNGDHIPRDVAYCLVHECAKLQDLQLGRQVHSLTVRAGLDSIAVLGDHLIRLFASCECLFEANYIFSKVIKPSQYTWNAIIAAYMKLEKSELSLNLYHRMWHESKIVDKFTFLNILKACSNTSAIEQCRYIHGHIIEYGLQSDLMVGSILVHTYSKCGELDEAQAIFDKLLIVDVVTWGALISGYAQHGKGLYALQCFYEMQDTGTRPNKVSFFSALKACSNMALIGQGRYIREHIIECKLHFDTHLMNTIVDMYAKCGHMDEAIRLLEKSRNRNVVTWGAIIAGYVKHGKGILALDMFEKMQTENIIPDKVIFVNILKASGSINATEKGKLIHEQIIESRLQMDIIVGTSLLDMYSKCGKLKEAENVFDMLPNRNAVTWGTIITGYVQHGENFLALEYLEHMLQEKLRPTKVSFLSTVKACSNLGSVQQGRVIHEQMLDSGLQLDAVLGSSLIDMYVKCGNLDEACGLFTKLPEHDIVTWDTMIAGYVKHGKCDLGLECFDNMQETGIIPDCVTFISVLKACGSIGAIEQGRQIHQKIIESGLQSDIVIGGMIVDMYAKCGNLDEARQVFYTMLRVTYR